MFSLETVVISKSMSPHTSDVPRSYGEPSFYPGRPTMLIFGELWNKLNVSLSPLSSDMIPLSLASVAYQSADE